MANSSISAFLVELKSYKSYGFYYICTSLTTVTLYYTVISLSLRITLKYNCKKEQEQVAFMWTFHAIT